MPVQQLHVCTGHRSALYCLIPGASAQYFLSAGGDGWIVEWDLDAPENGRLVASTEQQIFALFHAPDLGLIVAGNMSGGIHWIFPENPEQHKNIQAHQKGVYGFCRVGDHLLSIGGDGILIRWSLKDRVSVDSYHLSSKALRAIAYAPSRNELAIGSSDQGIFILEADSLRLKKTIPMAHLNSVFTLMYTAGEQLLLSGGRDAVLKVWDTQQETPFVREIPAHLFTINHIVSSPNGRLIATASRDKTIKIWRASDFELLKVIDTLRLNGHINSVNRLLWTDRVLISCSDDQRIMLWEIAEMG